MRLDAARAQSGLIEQEAHVRMATMPLAAWWAHPHKGET